MLTTEQVLALAPDPASAKAGRGLATPRSWVTLGRSDAAAWGECQGSGKEPYRTQVDPSGAATRCSCPSRKFPCKHALGLLLLLAAQPDALPAATPPPWVAEWLESRARAAQRRAPADETAPALETAPAKHAPAKSAAREAKAAAAREAKVAAGLAELRQWLRDTARQGLAAAQSRPAASWESVAARMVDAQARGLARLVREAGAAANSGDGWQERLLERLARLHLLAEGHVRLDALPPEARADLLAAIDQQYLPKKEELITGPTLRDTWLVIGQRVEEEDDGRLRVQRTWLWGREAERPALVLDFAVAGQPLDRSLVVGTALDAELAFYPSAAPLRALVVRQHASPAPIVDPPADDPRTATGRFAAALARNPWLERFPLIVGPVALDRSGESWLVRDDAGRQLPLARGFGGTWRMLAISGGRPFTVAGEWDGAVLLPLSAWADGRFYNQRL